MPRSPNPTTRLRMGSTRSCRRRRSRRGWSSGIGCWCSWRSEINNEAPVTAGRRKDKGNAIDQRTQRHTGYGINQRKHKRVEEPFGWGKGSADQASQTARQGAGECPVPADHDRLEPGPDAQHPGHEPTMTPGGRASACDDAARCTNIDQNDRWQWAESAPSETNGEFSALFNSLLTRVIARRRRVASPFHAVDLHHPSPCTCEQDERDCQQARAE